MPLCAVIGGTGLTSLSGLAIEREEAVVTPFGEPSSVVIHGELAGAKVVFLPRHGEGHAIAPHQINYRANVWALQHVGVTHVLAVNAVGGIGAASKPGGLLIPDQIVDYTWSREHTFFSDDAPVTHVDFTHPYSKRLRQILCEAARESGIAVMEHGTYGVTQGPRLETAAEIDRMEKDGCDVVGMTGMPEAGLARELALDYAAITVVVNHAAGRGPGEITMDIIKKNVTLGMAKVGTLLEHALPLIDTSFTAGR